MSKEYLAWVREQDCSLCLKQRNKQEIGATDREGNDVPIGGVVLIPKDADPDDWMKNAVHDKRDKA